MDIDEIQEKIRDSAIWILAGMEQMFTLRAFFFHLKENCGANSDQIRKVELAFKSASKAIFAIIGNLKYRSKLGELVRGIRRVFPHADSYPGEGTIAKLEAGGIMSIKDIVGKGIDELVALGVQRKYAELISAYIRKRQS